MEKTLDVSKSALNLPLYNTKHCVSAFLGQMIIGDILADKIIICFEFYLNEVVMLYSALVCCVKYFGGLEPKSKKNTFLKKNSVAYTFVFNSKHLEGQEIKCVSLRLEKNEKVLSEITFIESDFGHFIEALSIVLWHCLGLTRYELNTFLRYLELPLPEFLQLKDFAKLKIFLKENENSVFLAQLTRYHFPIFVILHKLSNLYNEDSLNFQVREIFEVS